MTDTASPVVFLMNIRWTEGKSSPARGTFFYKHNFDMKCFDFRSFSLVDLQNFIGIYQKL